MLEELPHRLTACPALDDHRHENRRGEVPMTKRQIVFGFICFLVGVLVGMEIAGNLDALVRLVIIVGIILRCVYLVLPYLPRRTRARRGAAQRVPQRRTQRKP